MTVKNLPFFWLLHDVNQIWQSFLILILRLLSQEYFRSENFAFRLFDFLDVLKNHWDTWPQIPTYIKIGLSGRSLYDEFLSNYSDYSFLFFCLVFERTILIVAECSSRMSNNWTFNFFCSRTVAASLQTQVQWQWNNNQAVDGKIIFLRFLSPCPPFFFYQ